MGNKTAFKKLIYLLKEIAEELRAMERQAIKSLTQENNHDQYRESQEEKTRLLISLPARIADHLSGLEPHVGMAVKKGLLEFAEDAQMAKKVNSLFYMSVLLSPEENQDDDNRNGFDNFITSLEKM